MGSIYNFVMQSKICMDAYIHCDEDICSLQCSAFQFGLWRKCMMQKNWKMRSVTGFVMPCKADCNE